MAKGGTLRRTFMKSSKVRKPAKLAPGMTVHCLKRVGRKVSQRNHGAAKIGSHQPSIFSKSGAR